MKRPALWSLLFLILGICLGRYGVGRFCTVLFSAFLILIALIKIKGKCTLILLSFTLIGALLMGNSMNFGKTALNEYASRKEEISITGIVKDIEDTSGGYKRLKLKLIHAENDKGEVLFNNEKGTYVLVMTNEADIEFNSKASMKITLENLSGPENFGGFNSMVYNGARGYDYSGFVDEISFSKGDKDFGYYIKTLRSDLGKVYDDIFPEEESGILKALITGYRGDLSENSKEIYKSAGIYHILAISGLHVSIFAGAVFLFLLKIVKLSRRTSAISSVGVIIFYALFTGGSVSVLRAAIMFGICMIGYVIGRNEDKINSLALAGIIILFVNPWFLFDAGFILSFVTTLGVILGIAVIKSSGAGKKKKMSAFEESVLLSLIVSGISIPVLIYFFGSVSLYSVIMNIVVSTLVPLILVLGLISGIAGLLFLNAGIFFGGGAYFLLEIIELISEFLNNTGFGIIFAERFSVISVVLYYSWFGLLLAIVSGITKRNIYKYISLAAALMFFVSVNANRFIFKNDEITFLNVGDGDSAVIKTFDNHVFVIDGGGNPNKNLGNNTGKNIVMPYLLSEGAGKIDGIFISHLDKDHALGAIELLDLAKVGAVYIPESNVKDKYLMNKLCEASQRSGVPVYEINSEDKFVLDKDSYIECLSPDEGNIISDSNRSSAVLKYVKGDFSILFTGDIDFAAEEDLISKGKDVSSNILKIPHHGAKTSSSEDFIKAVGNEVSIISAGESKIYNHPSDETIKRLSHTDIFITNDEGSIKIKTDGDGYETLTLRGE